MFQAPDRKKASRIDYGVEQGIMEMLFRLNDKKSSQLFRTPVDVRQVPDYYQRITMPMDLQTIAENLKESKYEQAANVYDDLNQIIQNCMEYNHNNFEILKKAESFRDCIRTEWGNFLKDMQRKMNISDSIIIDITPEVHERLLAMEDRRRKRKAASASVSSLESDTKRRFGENEYDYYTHLTNDEFMKSYHDEKSMRMEDPFSEFETKVENYHLLTDEEKRSRMRIEFDEPSIYESFEQNAKRKLEKYRKILGKKITWCDQKILRKVTGSKKYGGMTVPPHLIKFIEEYDMVKSLNIRRLQLFVKQIAYWMKEFQQVLGEKMKEKFLGVLRTIRRCIVQVVRYRRIQNKSTKIKLENPFLEPSHQQQQIGSDGQPIPEQGLEKPPQITIVESVEKEGDFDTRSNLSAETKSYEQKMKEFRRLLDRDIKQDRKKDTKILLVCDDNGDIVSRDPVIDDFGSTQYAIAEKLKPKKVGGKDPYRYQPPKEDEQKRRQQQLRVQRVKDLQFLQQYNKRSNLDILMKYLPKLVIDWEGDRDRQELQSTDFSFVIPIERKKVYLN